MIHYLIAVNRLERNKQKLVLSMLLEGSSIRATARTVGCHKKTVSDLSKMAGRVAARYQDQQLRNLDLERIQLDEIWSFLYAKQKNLPKLKQPRVAGDLWTWIAFCPDTKLVAVWRIGDRTAETAVDFLADLENRLADRIQLTTDGYSAYLEAVEAAFGGEVDYAMLSKVASREELEIRKQVIFGDPDKDHISTSLIERQNLTLRMSSRRYTRKTNAFSKKMENHALAVALHFLHYNFVRIHSTIRMTPAMAAGVTDRLYDLDWILDMVDEAWPKPKRPKIYRRK